MCWKQQNMKVIGHYDITQDQTAIIFYMIKPSINRSIRLGFLKQRKPFVTSDGAEIDFARFSMSRMSRQRVLLYTKLVVSGLVQLVYWCNP